jgi:hypothetical protein
MIRTFLPVILGFAIACAGTTAFTVLRARGAAPPPAAAPAAPLADTAHDTLPDVPYDGERRDTSHAATPKSVVDSVARSAAPAKAAGPAANADTAKPAAAPVKIAEPPAQQNPRSAAAPATQLEEGRLARLFAAMPARDAARVLEQMSDNDVVEILAGLTDRRAGEILSLFAAPRAATVAKALRTYTKKAP